MSFCIHKTEKNRCKLLSDMLKTNYHLMDSQCRLVCLPNGAEDACRALLKTWRESGTISAVKITNKDRVPIRSSDEMNRCWEICNECLNCECGLKNRINYGQCPENRW